MATEQDQSHGSSCLKLQILRLIVAFYIARGRVDNDPSATRCNAGTVLLLYNRFPDGDDDDISVFEVTIPISNLLFDNVKVHSMRHHLTLILACKST